jgi:TPR repeat protein
MGSTEAECRLGAHYRSGQGVAQDSEKAVEWFEKAATQGDADAHFALGNTYASG